MDRTETMKEICKLVLAYMPTSSIPEVIDSVDKLLKGIEHPTTNTPTDDLWAKWSPNKKGY